MVYFSMEEWDLLEEQKDLYKDVVMENQQLLSYVNVRKNNLLLSEMILNLTLSRPPVTSPDGSRKRNPPERCPRPQDSRDSAHDDHNYAHRFQGKDLIDLKVEVNVDQTFAKGDQSRKEVEISVPPHITMEDQPSLTSPDGTWKRNPPEGCPLLLDSRNSTQGNHTYVPIPRHDQVDRNERYEDLYKDLMMEPTHNSNPPEGCPCPRDSTQQEHNYAQHYQREDLMSMKANNRTGDEEEVNVRGDQPSMEEAGMTITETEEESSPDINKDGTSNGNSTERSPRDSTQGDLTTPHHDQVDGNEKHKDLYRDVMMEPTHNKNPPEGSPRPPYSWDSTLEDHNYAQYYQGEDPTNVEGNNKPQDEIHVGDERRSPEEAGMMITTENKEKSSLEVTKDGSSNGNTPETCSRPLTNEEDEMIVIGGQHFSEEVEMMDTDNEEQSSLDCSSDGRHVWNSSEEPVILSPDYKAEDDDITQRSPGLNPITHKRHHTPSPSETSMGPSNVGECSDKSCTKTPCSVHSMDRSHDPSNLSESSLSCKANLTEEHLWSCSVCGKGFTNFRIFLRHQRIHTSERPFPCTESRKHFTVKEALRHQRILSGACPFSCAECGKCFSMKGELLRHQSTHMSGAHFSCSDFRRCFPQKGKLAINQKRQIEHHPFSCLECGKCFVREEDLLKHHTAHAGEHPFSCSECDKCFIEKRTLLIHHSHTGEHAHSCLECGKSFTRNRTQRGLTGELPFSGSDCRKCFIHEDDLDRHQKSEHPFSCLKCGKCFSMKQSLLIHKTMHACERSFPCSDCGKCFSAKGKLLVHQRIHRGERPFSCSECGKCFSTKQSLLIHQRVHTGEHSSLCSACGKGFTEKGSQRHHAHQGPFSCS